MNDPSRTPAACLSEADSFESPSEAGITVSLLAAVEESSILTQRSLARRLGIALGLTNAYLKRCINKGLIKIAHAPANRYKYYLTPKGFAEKSRLTADYLTYSFDFLRRARADYEALFRICEERGWRRVALYGAGELADIASLSAQGYALTLLGPAAAADTASLAALAPIDAVVLTDHQAPQAAFDALVERMSPARVLAPRLLHVSRHPPRYAEEG